MYFILGNNENLRVAYSYELKGHEQMIEDLSFNPNDKDIICSVSDDKNIIFWDLRVSTTKNYDIPVIHTNLPIYILHFIYLFGNFFSGASF